MNPRRRRHEIEGKFLSPNSLSDAFVLRAVERTVGRRIPLLLATLVMAVAASGCTIKGDYNENTNTGPSGSGATTGTAAIAEQYKDAPNHYYNKVAGSDSSSRTIKINPGTAAFRVKAMYEVDGSAQFSLNDPLGMNKKSDNVAGSKQVRTESWFVVSSPTPGDWRFTASVGGSAEYAFGFYY